MKISTLKRNPRNEEIQYWSVFLFVAEMFSIGSKELEQVIGWAICESMARCRLVVSSNQWGFYQQKEWIWHWWMAMEGSCKCCHTWGNILSIAIPLQNRLCSTRMATSRLAIHSFIKSMRWYSLRQMLLVISTSFHVPKCDVINVIIKQTAHPRTNLGKL